MAESIIVVNFNVESEAYQGLSELKSTPNVQGSYQAIQGVLVKKEGGQIQKKDEFDTGAESVNDTVRGGIIGGLVGILGGPIGVLLGSGIGMFIGSGKDSNDILENSSMVEQVCTKLAEGSISLIVLVNEKEAGSFDSAFSKFGVSIERYSSEEVFAEVRQAEELEKQMAKEARKKLREEKKAARKQKFEEFKESAGLKTDNDGE